MSSSDISKSDLYESVKTLVECKNDHIHLNQHKLYTLFSVAFQYLLFTASKNPGAYIIRIEDSYLAEKLVKKSKDQTTRKFLQSLLVPRKMKYGKSMFFLDFFHLGTWNMTNEIPPEKLKGAIIIKSASSRPMTQTEIDAEEEEDTPKLPENFFITSLMEICPKTITIAFETELENVQEISFPFIKSEKEKALKGVTISEEIDWEVTEQNMEGETSLV